jgi:Zn-finger nucleic acid-binding protein
MDELVERTMWCPKRCDLLVMEAKPNPYEFKWNLKVIIFCVIALISAYIWLNEPPFIFDNLPIEIPATYFGIVTFLSVIMVMRLSQGTINEYVCPSCKGVVFDIDRFKHVRKGKVTNVSLLSKSSTKKHKAILQLLNDSSELSELQCPSCSKDMNSIDVLYEREVDGNSRSLLGTAIEIAAAIALDGTYKMEIEGCKKCNILWFDKLEDSKFTSHETTLISDEEVQE